MNAVGLPSILDDSRMGELLDLWARWMRSSQPYRELWYPDQACGCVGGGYSHDFDSMVMESDTRSAEAVGATIDGLNPIEQCSVYHVHLAAVYRFRLPVEMVYDNARYTLRVVLPQRGIY